MNSKLTNNNEYKLLNNTQARKFQLQLLNMDRELKFILFESIKFYCEIIFNILDDYVKIKDMNNNLLNCLFYKIIEYNKIKINKEIIDEMISYSDNRYSFYNLLLKFDEEITKNRENAEANFLLEEKLKI